MFQKLALVFTLICLLAAGTSTATASLVGYWPLDEGQGAVAKDMSGGGHDGTINGTADWVDGASGFRSALKFGTGGGLGVDCGQWKPTAATNQLTVACWLYWIPGGTSQYQGIVCNRTSYSATTLCWAIEASTSATAASLQFGSIASSAYGLGNLATSQWQHFVLTFDGTTVTTYLNGAQVGSGSAAFGSDNSSAVRIGSAEAAGNTFNGIMDDVRIYDTVLSTTELVALSVPPVYQTADRPVPSNNATDVRRDVILGWKAAPVALSHDVYFGTSQADVAAASRQSPGAVLVSQGQDANTYDPTGMLAINTDYYWRVDEVDASSTYKGDVWKFTTEPYSYTMTNVTATASSAATGTSAQLTVDGAGLDTSDLHGTSTSPATMWLTDSKATGPAWIQFAFDAAYKVSEMWVWNYNAAFETEFLGFGIKTATLDYSVDGTNWTSFGEVTFDQGPGTAGYAHNTVLGLDIAAKYIKLTPKSNFSGRAQYGLSEVRFFYIPTMAREPKPAAGATGVSPSDVTLGWRGGREAVAHKVLFSTDSNAVTNGTAVVASTDQTTYDAGDLDLGKTYYWRVDEVNDAGHPAVWTGNLWSFTTSNYIVVDDMESYTDDAGKELFSTWVDGYGTGTNGCLVGWPTAPYAEKTIIHGGKQSMPYSYDNSKASSSEAKRTWTTPVDWTVSNADTLRLFVQGRPVSFLETASGTIAMSGAGTDIYQMTDQFRFAYKSLTGNGSITARIDSIQNTGTWAKSGVMIRMGTTVGAMQVHMVGCPSNRVEFMPRLVAGTNATGTSTAADSAMMPQWVRLTRNGNVFTGEYSADGKTWNTVATTTPATIPMTDPVYIGLVVNSNTATTLCDTRFSSVSFTGDVTGQWQLAEVGTTQPVGNTPDTLYVTLSDDAGHSATVKNADPLACVSSSWQEWSIPFSSFSGVSTNRIQSMVIGVGDKASPKLGVGQLYIDDIGVGHPAP